MGVNIPILEIYGMSESTGSHTMNLMGGGRWRVGSAGQALVGTEIKIHCPDENGDGEVGIAFVGGGGLLCDEDEAGSSVRLWVGST